MILGRISNLGGCAPCEERQAQLLAGATSFRGRSVLALILLGLFLWAVIPHKQPIGA